MGTANGWRANTARRADALTTAVGPMADLGSRRKVHMAMDTETGDILAVEFTSSHEGDSALLPDLLAQIPRTVRVSKRSPQTGPTIRAVVSTRSLRAALSPSSRSAEIDACGNQTVPPRSGATKHCTQHSALVGGCGRSGQAIMSEVASRPR